MLKIEKKQNIFKQTKFCYENAKNKSSENILNTEINKTPNRKSDQNKIKYN